MGRKRRKIIKKVSRPYPTIFICPLCSAQAVTVTHEEGDTALVKCGNCGVSHEVPWHRSYMALDAYSVWYDVVTGRRSIEDVQREIMDMRRVPEEVVIGEAEENMATSGGDTGESEELEASDEEQAQGDAEAEAKN